MFRIASALKRIGVRQAPQNAIGLSVGIGYYLKEVNDTTLTWNYFISADKGSELWRLEKISYKSGDIDTNYIVNADDAQLILQASAKLITLNNMQSFLADIDGDGFITATDAQKLLQIIAQVYE